MTVGAAFVADLEAADASALFLAAIRRRDQHFAIAHGSAATIARSIVRMYSGTLVTRMIG